MIRAAFILALSFGAFTYAWKAHRASAGSTESVSRDAIAFPWVGVGAIVIGGVLLFMRPTGLTAPPTARDQSEALSGGDGHRQKRK